MRKPDDTDPDSTAPYRQAPPARRKPPTPSPRRAQAPAPRSRRALLIAGGILGANLLLLAAIGTWWAWPAKPKPSPKDPYPECAAIREWLSKNAPDPARTEVVDWGERVVVEPPGDKSVPAGSVIFDIRTREPNRQGILEIRVGRRFIFSPDGKLRMVLD